ncbi:hypothetical protein FOS14_21835 [Skermania sp. ID1734]|uniref:SWIM zinc finger family protein n=1 Tax=Skermania sp. ID1734 TaxID=2597516 RepID=UPI00117BDFFA|nr:SWIM zinc finger family protein [Skermania sp. ID1734]TSD93924.1 hypothetical protein FOS14_21835 [Skermania sp. ID1734]
MPFIDYSQYGTRRPVRGGVAARSRRGSFGQSWWARSLVESVEALADSGRLTRGRSYARSGQVVSMTVGAGVVSAEVQGSQPDPFSSEFIVRPLTQDAVDDLISTVRATPGMLAEIVSGSLPTSLGPLLLPTSASDLDFACSCPDIGWPCKHVAAVVYLTAEQLDERPLDILTLRGVDLDTLINGVEADDGEESDDPYGAGIVLPSLPSVPVRPAMDDLDPQPLRRALRDLTADPSDAFRELSEIYGRLTQGR